jgi:hypothetical protein
VSGDFEPFPGEWDRGTLPPYLSDGLNAIVADQLRAYDESFRRGFMRSKVLELDFLHHYVSALACLRVAEIHLQGAGQLCAICQDQWPCSTMRAVLPSVLLGVRPHD